MLAAAAAAKALLGVMLVAHQMVGMVVAAQAQVSRVHLSLMPVVVGVGVITLQALAALAVAVQELITATVRQALRTEVVVVEDVMLLHPVPAGREL
jgi:hypothetical protein